MTNATPAKRRILPPVYFLAALLLMIAIWLLAPSVLPFPKWLRLIGFPLIVLGCVLVLWPAQLFERYGTTIKPFEQSRALVTTGPYRISRNPIYLGMVTALTGLGFLLGSIPPLVVVPAFALAIDRLVIRAEESMLGAAFGDTYRTYSLRVRRWL